VDAANEDFAKIEQVKKFHLLDRELSEEEGEITPTQKLKREAIAETWKDEIEALYDD
jgi:long-chain acyl-CoA synthetase